MVAAGMITLGQRDEAANEPIDAKWRALPQESSAGDGLLPTLTRLAESHPGRRMRANIDRHVQQQCASSALETLRELGPSRVTAAAVVVLDTPSGKCLSSVSLVNAGSGAANALDLTQCAAIVGFDAQAFHLRGGV